MINLEQASFTLLPDFVVLGYGNDEQRRGNIEAFYSRPAVPELTPVPAHDGVLTVVAYGPSLKKMMARILDEARAGNTVMTVSGAHDFLIGNGVIPDYHAEMDIRARKAEFVHNNREEVTYLIASVCHPDIWDALDGRNVMAWHVGDMAGMDEMIRSHNPLAIMHPSAQCIGLNALILGHTLGFRTFSMYGFDCSYAEGEPHAGRHNGNNNDDARLRVLCGDREFETRPEWIKYARNFMEEMLPRMPGCRFAVHGDGLMQAMLREGMKANERQ